MIAFVSHHYALPGKGDELRRRLDQTGITMSAYPGFIARYNLQAVDDPTHVTAVALWESEAALDGWDNGPDRGRAVQQPQGEPVMDASRPIWRVRFKVVGEYKPAQAAAQARR